MSGERAAEQRGTFFRANDQRIQRFDRLRVGNYLKIFVAAALTKIFFLCNFLRKLFACEMTSTVPSKKLIKKVLQTSERIRTPAV